MTWAHAEPAIGMIAANLPALRPLLERALAFLSTLKSRLHSDARSAGPPRAEFVDRMALRAPGGEEGKGMGNETRIMEGHGGADVRASPSENQSQGDVVGPEQLTRLKRNPSFGVKVRPV
jgi:hypothetical protein